MCGTFGSGGALGAVSVFVQSVLGGSVFGCDVGGRCVVVGWGKGGGVLNGDGDDTLLQLLALLWSDQLDAVAAGEDVVLNS